MPPKKNLKDDDNKSLGSAGGATVATAATGDTKLSAASLKSGSAQIEMDGMLDDVSVLGMDQGSVASAGVNGGVPEENAGGGGEGDARVEEEEYEEGGDEEGGGGGCIDEEGEEEKESGERGGADDATKMSGLTKDSGDGGEMTGKKKGGGIGGFFKKLQGKAPLPKVTSGRRFSVDGIKIFAKKVQRDEKDMTIDPYIPAIKFHERMSRRKEKFHRKKEEVAEIVNNAEHNKFSLADNMKTY